MQSDLVLLNARIHTLDARMPWATALVIRGEHIVYVGDDATARERGAGGQRVDLRGRCVIPGLNDAHLHFQWYAEALQSVDAETPTLAEALDRVAERARTTPPGDWIVGTGWNHNVWGGLPSGADLDRVAPAHPAM